MNRSDKPVVDQPAIVLRNLVVRRGQTTLLDQINCTLPAGRCAAILGPNGSGKTTLTRVLTGQAFITSGQATVLGRTIGATDIRALRRLIGVVNPTMDLAGAHQAGSVVDGDLSARDAVLTGFFGTVGLYDSPTEAQRKKAEQALAQVGLTDRSDLRCALLSTGEQRRCLIARALVNEPRLLIFDEPTAGLDVAGREQVLATIDRILQQPHPPTVLLITHHVEELSPMTVRVLLLRAGKLVADGPPDELIDAQRLSETFGCPVAVRKRNGRYWLEAPGDA